VLKENMVIAPILVFLDWKKKLHVHVDASCIVIGAILTQAGEEELDHPIAFTSQKLSKDEKTYSMTKHEGFAMVYALQKFKRYLLHGHFKMYTDHSPLKYLVNKPVFQEYDFEVIMKPGHLNAGPNQLSCIKIAEDPTNSEEGLPYM